MILVIGNSSMKITIFFNIVLALVITIFSCEPVKHSFKSRINSYRVK